MAKKKVSSGQSRRAAEHTGNNAPWPDEFAIDCQHAENQKEKGGVRADRHRGQGVLRSVGPGGRKIAFDCGTLGGTERELKPEGRAGLGFVAEHSDSSAHRLDQLFADRQAETGASKAPAGGAIGLKECFKNTRPGRFSYADT